MSLREEYERLCSVPSDIYLHLPRLVELTEATNAQHVIELGTRTGVSTVAWLYALEGTGGRLTSVDIDEKPPIGDHPSWTFIQGSDLSADVFGQLSPAEIVFIDTSHTYDQTIAELNAYRSLVKPGGLFVLHDTELIHPEDSPPSDPPFPVRVAVQEFCDAGGREWFNVAECNGLGVIQM